MVGAPDSGSTGAEPPMGSGVAIGIWTALSAAAGSGTGAVAGVVASPIGAIESLGDAGGVGMAELGMTESCGGPPKLSPSSRKFSELRGTTRLVPSG